MPRYEAGPIPFNPHIRTVVSAGGGGGTPAWVQDDGATFDPFNSARSVSFGSSTASGNCIIAVYRGSNTGSLVVTDNKSNSYNIAVTGGTSGIVIAYALNITGGASHQVTFTVTSHSNPGQMIIMEVSGIATASALDDSDEANPGFSSNATLAMTSTVNNAFMFGCMFSSLGGATAGTGLTLRHAQDGTLQTATGVAASAGAHNVGFVHSERNCQISAIILKPA